MYIHKTKEDKELEVLTENELLGKMLEIGVENPIVTYYNWTNEKDEHKVTIDGEEHLFVYSKEVYELQAIFDLEDGVKKGMTIVTGNIESILYGLNSSKSPVIKNLSKHISMFMELNDKDIACGDKVFINIDKIKATLTFYR